MKLKTSLIKEKIGLFPLDPGKLDLPVTEQLTGACVYGTLFYAYLTIPRCIALN